jgi:hypothetical protein
MRNILDGSQSFDIILNSLLVDEKNCEIQQGGTQQSGTDKVCFIDFNCYQRNTLFKKLLKSNQNKIDLSKKKILLKQNILGLLKTNLIDDAEQYLFIDPSVYNEKNFWNEETKKKVTDNFDNIDNINVIDKYNNKKMSSLFNESTYQFINNLIIEYFSLKSNLKKEDINMEITLKETVEVEVETQKILSISNLIFKNTSIPILINVLLLSPKKILSNSIILNYTENKVKNNLFILYEHKQNNIFIFNDITFNTFLSYNNYAKILNNYIIISLKNNYTYGSSTNIENIDYYRILIKEFLLYRYRDKKLNEYTLTYEEIKFVNKNKDKYIKISDSFKQIYSNT